MNIFYKLDEDDKKKLLNLHPQLENWIRSFENFQVYTFELTLGWKETKISKCFSRKGRNYKKIEYYQSEYIRV